MLVRCRRAARPLALVSMLLLLPQGCGAWRAYGGAPRDAMSGEDKRDVRLHLVDGTRRAMYKARLVHDSIVGYGTYSDERNGSLSTIPMSDVRSIDTRVTSTVRSLLVFTAIAGTLALLFASPGSQSGPQTTGCVLFSCGA